MLSDLDHALTTLSRLVWLASKQKRRGWFSPWLFPLLPRENFLKKEKRKVLCSLETQTIVSLCRVLFCSGRIRQIFGWCPDTGSGCVSTSFCWGNSIAYATKGRATFSATLVLREEPWVQSLRHLVLAWLRSTHPTTHSWGCLGASSTECWQEIIS